MNKLKIHISETLNKVFIEIAQDAAHTYVLGVVTVNYDDNPWEPGVIFFYNTVENANINASNGRDLEECIWNHALWIPMQIQVCSSENTYSSIDIEGNYLRRYWLEGQGLYLNETSRRELRKKDPSVYKELESDIQLNFINLVVDACIEAKKTMAKGEIDFSTILIRGLDVNFFIDDYELNLILNVGREDSLKGWKDFWIG